MTDAPPLVLSYLGGTVTFQREAGLPFQDELIGGLESLGIENETVSAVNRAFPSAPTPVGRSMPSNSLTVLLVVGFGLYVAGKLGDKLIDEAGSDLYQDVLKPSIQKFWSRLTGARANQHLVLTLDHWFDQTGVLVRVEFHATPDWSQPPDDDQVRTALNLAQRYIAERGVTHRVMVYRVENAELDDTPELLAALPQPGHLA